MHIVSEHGARSTRECERISRTFFCRLPSLELSDVTGDGERWDLAHWAPPVGAPPRVNSSGVVFGRQKALSKTRLPRAVDAPSAHSGRSCRPDNPFPQLPPRRCAGKSTVLRGEPDMESERAMLSSLDFPTESCPFGQRATLGCAHLMPQHMQHACTPPFKCLSPTGGRMNLN